MIYNSTLAEQVAEYNSQMKPEADSEYCHYQNRSSLDEAIRYATHAIKANGKKHSHQHRITVWAMESVERRLMGCQQDLLACRDFEELHKIVQGCAVSGFAVLSI